MTKKQRAQVVELLRCAADIAMESSGIWRACEALGHGAWSYPARSAWHASREVLGGREHDFMETDEYRGFLLEAAARVEEGSYP